MTYKEACKFFWDHGNVGNSLEEIESTQPTSNQLFNACFFASKRSRQPDSVIQSARVAIINYWQERNNQNEDKT